MADDDPGLFDITGPDGKLDQQAMYAALTAAHHTRAELYRTTGARGTIVLTTTSTTYGIIRDAAAETPYVGAYQAGIATGPFGFNLVIRDDVPDNHVQIRTTCPACGLLDHEPACPVGRQIALVAEFGLEDPPRNEVTRDGSR